jgi:hypothetical protein
LTAGRLRDGACNQGGIKLAKYTVLIQCRSGRQIDESKHVPTTNFIGVFSPKLGSAQSTGRSMGSGEFPTSSAFAKSGSDDSRIFCELGIGSEVKLALTASQPDVSLIEHFTYVGSRYSMSSSTKLIIDFKYL